MSENAPPSLDPADDDSMQGLLKGALRKFLQGVDDMLPARVVSYDRPSNKVVLAPMVALLTSTGATVTRAQVQGVPVFRYGAGGFVLSFNLKAGDMGWIKANDRDISLFVQALSGSKPNTLRLHSFEDAMFFPDSMRDVVINDEDAENAVFQSNDGQFRIAIASDKIKISAGDATTLTLTPERTDLVTPIFNVDAGSIVLQGIEWLPHTHGGVVPGGADTSGVSG